MKVWKALFFGQLQRWDRPPSIEQAKCSSWLSLTEDLTHEEEIHLSHQTFTRAVDSNGMKCYFCGICVCTLKNSIVSLCWEKILCGLLHFFMFYEQRQCSGQYFHGCLNSEKNLVSMTSSPRTETDYLWVILIIIMSLWRRELALSLEVRKDLSFLRTRFLSCRKRSVQVTWPPSHYSVGIVAQGAGANVTFLVQILIYWTFMS